MLIYESSAYKKDVKQKLIKKNKIEELKRLDSIKVFILSKNNLLEVMQDPIHNYYRIEKKSGNLKEIYTAHLNKKVRLKMKPIGDYPYNIIEITEIEFSEIDDKHYKEG